MMCNNCFNEKKGGEASKSIPNQSKAWKERKADNHHRGKV